MSGIASGAATARFALRPMGEGDIPAVMGIERTLFAEDAWSESTLRAEMAGRPATRYYLVAEVGHVVVAYAGLAAAGPEGGVQTLAVLPDQRGRGIGTALLDALLDEADRRGCAEVFLEVRADNPRARSLYERFGFHQVGTRPQYYQPSGTDAVVMRLTGVRARRVSRGESEHRGRRGVGDGG